MKSFCKIFLTLFPFALLAQSTPTPSISSFTTNFQLTRGFFDVYWDENSGKLYLQIDQWDDEFLYVNSLASGVGSNDIGLDRNQLGQNRIVKFIKIGPKVLLIQPNQDYRAISDSEYEVASVEEAFASSVIWGAKVEAINGQSVLVDLTPLLLSDAHSISETLKSSRQGTYKINPNTSAVYLPKTKNFPENSEFEAITTFDGEPGGSEIRSVVPTPTNITVRQHHSFIKLPDDEYEPRIFLPASGYFPHAYFDYATPIDQPIEKQFIYRHRLTYYLNEDSTALVANPIIYYVDRGTPEPIRSALIEGASWWNEAFEASGFKDGFQVKVLPEGADPMDVRYNMINWVHRSTRGWSYGSSISDPRTGEILKGHVLLGSLRVRQDFLIAQGLLEAYVDGLNPDPALMEFALARLRQLSAHEVGHTLGLSHNFAASVNSRASVMDYPHPLVTIGNNGKIDLSNAYSAGIGEWDIRTILYGYANFDGDEKQALMNILNENIELGLNYLSDRDARDPAGANPDAHLWDNGASPHEELSRISRVRDLALKNFSIFQIPTNTPMANLENVLVPVYLMHRYQVEAAVKVIGGLNYTYSLRGQKNANPTIVNDDDQRSAFGEVLKTIKPEFLTLSENILQLIPPQPAGYSRNRELFKTRTGPTFDPISAAESSADHTLKLLLHPARLSRIIEHHARYPEMLSLPEYFTFLISNNSATPDNLLSREINRMIQKRVLEYLLNLAGTKTINQQVSAVALSAVSGLDQQYRNRMKETTEAEETAHLSYMVNEIRLFRENPVNYKWVDVPALPDGAPIGCTMMD